MTRLYHLLFASAMLLAACSCSDDVLNYVNPAIGTQGMGNIVIGPCRPFSMVRPSPDCTLSSNSGYKPMPERVDAGETVTGIPYSSLFNEKGLLAENVSFHTFLSTLANPRSLMYTVDYRTSTTSKYVSKCTCYGTRCTGSGRA